MKFFLNYVERSGGEASVLTQIADFESRSTPAKAALFIVPGGNSGGTAVLTARLASNHCDHFGRPLKETFIRRGVQLSAVIMERADGALDDLSGRFGYQDTVRRRHADTPRRQSHS